MIFSADNRLAFWNKWNLGQQQETATLGWLYFQMCIFARHSTCSTGLKAVKETCLELEILNWWKHQAVHSVWFLISAKLAFECWEKTSQFSVPDVVWFLGFSFSILILLETWSILPRAMVIFAFSSFVSWSALPAKAVSWRDPSFFIFWHFWYSLWGCRSYWIEMTMIREFADWVVN